MNRAFSRKKDKTWMHTPEALSKHYIPYNAKFLGSTEVEQPKGTEVVRDAVRKLKFARHIKKSEGQKIPKVELQISIYGVKILEPKSKEVQHNCQLHRISFCADDKTDKRIFTFICKDSESNKHLCYVFDSEKCAEEITLTIGQAFDLAYRKFLESGGKDVETRKQIAVLQKRNLVFSCDFASLPDASHGDQSSRSSRCWIQDLETENMELKNKVQDLENQLRITQVSTSPLLHKMSDHEQHGFQRCSPSFWRRTDDSSPCLNISSITVTPVNSPDSRLSLGLLIPPPSKCGLSKPISESSIPRPHAGNVTPKCPSTDIFDMIPFSPVSHQSSIPTRNGTQPPPVPSRSTEIKRDLFGAEPFDPFNCGAGDFPPDIQSKLDEMQEGFKMGLTLEGTVFCLDPLDSRC
ncbi:PTB domain-containing engulfment adapter protein 1 isoform X1 [Balaenoptera acutorostrata]|uniref:PTB domain-containing engulfment adapter protein 1 isoform X1 n=1 Tax=Balaenoptera acutorostrata TaxID=9767 RepID=A0ABM3U0E2_BALAC|nr:PTB domain-containing engulfment adapter protein 1 isoform X1 [Balaenoptera acutorostrata]XP_057407811.1 PTB domain-containing engulfment adapter protein 1 isoform X1 [Balaenoptera acutorostrata]XP_057407812.1 PTB domain-containing engulfment adapter protein 1 isoform X1 [Balaenoptera acutorostrata]XP_057407813.1 PTB domain-containing engulfment adapter protein 1 isoform X1 [Balaenoptera acutorostrata]XP_057407814.1 PTB domain-containing engulfment adapter protein 1 isoform X1 [Balaenoptera 